MLRAYTDGACDNKKNIAGCGVIIYRGEDVIFQSAFYLYRLATSNEAEYYALLECLKFCQKHLPGEEVNIFLDSQIVVRQYTGVYKCRKENLKPLLNRAKELSKGFYPVLRWVRREENKEADRLSKIGLKLFYND